MSYPKQQYVLARKRGRRTRYFYGVRLKDVLGHVRDGEEFVYFTLTRGEPQKATFNGRNVVYA